MMAEKTSIRSKIQKFGSNLSSMIMPNIGAFIAWGIITAIFAGVTAYYGEGSSPAESVSFLEAMVSPMITYLLPLLIAFTGGRILHDFRGGVVGATATMGVIAATDVPMFIGAMIMGPLGGYLIKKVDQKLDGKVKQGFEMLVNNFSAGILAVILACFGSLAVAPLVSGLTTLMGLGAETIIGLGLLPLASIFIEPAKVMFLNNAINHGILTPISIEQVRETGKSIFYLLEANPGPGIGVLLAFMFFGKGASKASAYGAGVIHFFGGIHEIYFPYVLMKPLMFLAVIFGGMTGVFVFSAFDVGLVSPASPGSIIPIIGLAAPGDYFYVLLGVLAAAAVSFAIGSLILKFDRKGEEENLADATSKMEAMKGKKSGVSASLNGSSSENKTASYADVNKIVFACDAGMGSSAMGASIMRDRVKKAGLDTEVINTSISNIPDDADLVITHKDLTDRAKSKKSDAIHVSVDNFMNSPRYNEIIEELQNGSSETSVPAAVDGQKSKEDIQKIIFACDAGMGSSAMGASILKNKVKKAELDVSVSNTSISNIPADADVVVTHKDLTDRAKQKQPNAEHISVENFMNSPKYDELIDRLK
ncbi:PTS mannitol-specific transporter subunit IIBC [Alkalicoccobacillus plakortidis]|uniref:PTS system mannitol-specific EIICB component n=1 Tax=Alkalicoccobacillus plakortidis TaxID=444060 RepID=A0ABT0XHR7_9BACI|nr:PTS mannitol-specific transporter subunit IIBC [Alkalicoccobacillus plakortidis]MCM2675455.1 PTS mannitol-specific transporter subunit IIBC [Alkalicoccobacillus plakortidis]